MLPFCSPDLFIIQNLWPSNRLHRDVWIAVNVCLHNGPVPGSKAGEGLIFLPSACLSVIRIIGVELGGNATNVKQYIPRIGAVLVHNGALCWTGSPSSEGNAPWREKSAFLLRKRHHRIKPLHSATQLLCTLNKTDGVKKEKFQILSITLISSVSLWGMRCSLPISFLRVKYGAVAGRWVASIAYRLEASGNLQVVLLGK